MSSSNQTTANSNNKQFWIRFLSLRGINTAKYYPPAGSHNLHTILNQIFPSREERLNELRKWPLPLIGRVISGAEKLLMEESGLLQKAVALLNRSQLLTMSKSNIKEADAMMTAKTRRRRIARPKLTPTPAPSSTENLAPSAETSAPPPPAGVVPAAVVTPRVSSGLSRDFVEHVRHTSTQADIEKLLKDLGYEGGPLNSLSDSDSDSDHPEDRQPIVDISSLKSRKRKRTQRKPRMQKQSQALGAQDPELQQQENAQEAQGHNMPRIEVQDQEAQALDEDAQSGQQRDQQSDHPDQGPEESVVHPQDASSPRQARLATGKAVYNEAPGSISQEDMLFSARDEDYDSRSSEMEHHSNSAPADAGALAPDVAGSNAGESNYEDLNMSGGTEMQVHPLMQPGDRSLMMLAFEEEFFEDVDFPYGRDPDNLTGNRTEAGTSLRVDNSVASDTPNLASPSRSWQRIGNSNELSTTAPPLLVQPLSERRAPSENVSNDQPRRNTTETQRPQQDPKTDRIANDTQIPETAAPNPGEAAASGVAPPHNPKPRDQTAPVRVVTKDYVPEDDEPQGAQDFQIEIGFDEPSESPANEPNLPGDIPVDAIEIAPATMAPATKLLTNAGLATQQLDSVSPAAAAASAIAIPPSLVPASIAPGYVPATGPSTSLAPSFPTVPASTVPSAATPASIADRVFLARAAAPADIDTDGLALAGAGTALALTAPADTVLASALSTATAASGIGRRVTLGPAQATSWGTAPTVSASASIISDSMALSNQLHAAADSAPTAPPLARTSEQPALLRRARAEPVRIAPAEEAHMNYSPVRIAPVKRSQRTNYSPVPIAPAPLAIAPDRRAGQIVTTNRDQDPNPPTNDQYLTFRNVLDQRIPFEDMRTVVRAPQWPNMTDVLPALFGQQTLTRTQLTHRIAQLAGRGCGQGRTIEDQLQFITELVQEVEQRIASHNSEAPSVDPNGAQAYLDQLTQVLAQLQASRTSGTPVADANESQTHLDGLIRGMAQLISLMNAATPHVNDDEAQAQVSAKPPAPTSTVQEEEVHDAARVVGDIVVIDSDDHMSDRNAAGDSDLEPRTPHNMAIHFDRPSSVGFPIDHGESPLELAIDDSPNVFIEWPQVSDAGNSQGRENDILTENLAPSAEERTQTVAQIVPQLTSQMASQAVPQTMTRTEHHSAPQTMPQAAETAQAVPQLAFQREAQSTSQIALQVAPYVALQTETHMASQLVSHVAPPLVQTMISTTARMATQRATQAATQPATQPSTRAVTQTAAQTAAQAEPQAARTVPQVTSQTPLTMFQATDQTTPRAATQAEPQLAAPTVAQTLSQTTPLTASQPENQVDPHAAHESIQTAFEAAPEMASPYIEAEGQELSGDVPEASTPENLDTNEIQAARLEPQNVGNNEPSAEPLNRAVSGNARDNDPPAEPQSRRSRAEAVKLLGADMPNVRIAGGAQTISQRSAKLPVLSEPQDQGVDSGIEPRADPNDDDAEGAAELHHMETAGAQGPNNAGTESAVGADHVDAEVIPEPAAADNVLDAKALGGMLRQVAKPSPFWSIKRSSIRRFIQSQVSLSGHEGLNFDALLELAPWKKGTEADYNLDSDLLYAAAKLASRGIITMTQQGPEITIKAVGRMAEDAGVLAGNFNVASGFSADDIHDDSDSSDSEGLLE